MADGGQGQMDIESGRDFYQMSVTAPSEEEARWLGQMAVESRLAACAQVGGPIWSTYWWEGEVTSASEYRCTLKTSSDRLPELMEVVRRAHSYETPEIVAQRIATGDPAYLTWIGEETRVRPLPGSEEP
jgi:periplasmic divalent cation tolerance protein